MIGDDACVFVPCQYCTLTYIDFFFAVNATTDLPSEVKVSVSPSIPHFPDSGVFETYHYQNYTSYSCDTLLKAPAGDDAGYSCPDAGVYNYRFTFGMFGDPDAWYGSYHGFNVGMSVKIFDVGNNADYGFCYLEMKVKKGADSSYSDLAFFGTGLASLTGVAAVGYMYRRRKLATLAPHSHAEAEETITNFELISDQFVNV